MKEKKKKGLRILNVFRNSMTTNIIGTVVTLLAALGVIVSIIGLVNFTAAFKNEYTTTTYHMADTATMLVNGNRLEGYIAGRNTEEYERTKGYLDSYCKKMSVSIAYVIMVDQSDYGRFVSVFNSVFNSVDNTNYTEWERGYKRDTTNDEYRQKYKAIYEEGSPYETVFRINTTDGQHPHVTTMVPVRNTSGDVTGILCIQRPMREIVEARRPYILNVAVWTFALAVVAGVIFSLFIRLKFMKPIRKVSEETTRFAKENTKGEPLGSISRFKEIQNMAESVDTLETDMVNYIENLTVATADKERIVTELTLASTIQENSIPNDFPAFPGRTDFDIYASMTPAKAVGGDFYNFYLIDDTHLGMVIGDVSGKGVPAALFMMVTNILISEKMHMGGAPEDILASVNDDICKHNKADMFVTLWLGILDLKTGTLRAANAGHEYPAIMQPGGAFELLKDKHGLAVGAMEGVKYKGYELQLEPGAKLFVYTDGVPEATDADNKMFGTERMLAALNSEPSASPEGVLNNVRAAVDGFVKGAEQFDDLTMLCFEYNGRAAEDKKEI